MTEALELDELYTQLMTKVRFAREALAEGQVVSLDTLEAKVGHLCKQIAALEKENQPGWSERLQQLHDATDALGREMLAEQTSITQEMKGVSLHRKANTAYQSSVHLPPKPEKDS